MTQSHDGAATAGAVIKIPRIHDVQVAVGAGVGAIGILTIQQDADFEWWLLSIQRTSALLQVLITEQGVGNRQLIYPGTPPQVGTYNGMFVDNLAGLMAANAALPLPVPYVMPAGRTYTHQFLDTSGFLNNVEFAYHGYALLSVPQ